MPFANAGETPHFSIHYEQTSLSAQAIAQAILSICESNFNAINALLPIPAGETSPGGQPPFTGLMPIVVNIYATPGGFLGRNFGYEKTVRSLIEISQALTPAVGQQVFAAELAEIFMGFHRWTLSDSQGEGLSVLCRDELYRAPFDIRVDAWLNASPRPNFVATAKNTDTDAVSYGCGLLFLNYLHYQLGYPFSAICQAAGVTLTDRYRALTGKTDDGFAGFRDLLEKHLPITNGPYALATDNPFPLYEDPKLRSIFPTAHKHTYSKTPLHARAHGKVHVRPFFTCPLADYAYHLVAYKDTVAIEVSVVGFAQPVYEWRIGTQTISSVNATNVTSGQTTVTAEIDRPSPTHPGAPTHGSALLTVDYSVSNQFSIDSMSSTLVLSNVNVEGIYFVDVELSVSELGADVGKTTLVQRVRIKTLEVIYEAAFYADQRRCEHAFERKVSVPDLGHMIERVNNLPDPPDDSRRMIVEAVLALQAELPKVLERDRDAAHVLVNYAASVLQVPPSIIDRMIGQSRTGV